MRLNADTNILVRVLVDDDPVQSAMARAALAGHEVVITLPTLCELVWVLRTVYRRPVTEVAATLRALMENAATDRTAAEAGLRMLDAGGDFADGVIAFEGQRLGAEVFVSFDKRAVKLLEAAGEKAELLG